MTPPSPMPDAIPEAVRRQVAHELYTRLGLYSDVAWTLGTSLLSITFAASNPKPIFPAMFSMTAPLVIAALPWLFYRPLTRRLAERRVREESRRARGGTQSAPGVGGAGGPDEADNG